MKYKSQRLRESAQCRRHKYNTLHSNFHIFLYTYNSNT